MQQQQDMWMHPSEEARFNVIAKEWNAHLLPLIKTDHYLSAFFDVHRRFNKLIPNWATGPASQFVDLVDKQWVFYKEMANDVELPQEKHAIVIGAARRL